MKLFGRYDNLAHLGPNALHRQFTLILHQFSHRLTLIFSLLLFAQAATLSPICGEIEEGNRPCEVIGSEFGGVTIACLLIGK